MRAERDRRDDEVREYFAARAQAMRRTAYVVVRDWHTAEDMVQLTFVQLYTHPLPRRPPRRRGGSRARHRRGRTVKSQTSRALATLRRHLPDLDLEETR